MTPETAPLRVIKAFTLSDSMLTVFILSAFALSGCVDPLALYRQGTEFNCISQCQVVKDRCDANARWDYRQCETGYGDAQSDYLWCNSRGEEQCGYPWWSCSQNLYGYCTNRFHECQEACRQTSRRGKGTNQQHGPRKSVQP